MKNVMGHIHSVETFGALDGPGIRYVVFLQGCPMRCLYCHNPDSWSPGGGNVIGSEQLVKDILAYKNFIKKGGVTLSGGEPLFQSDFAFSIIEGCHENGLHTAVDTSGAVPLSRCRDAAEAADLLLLDIKASVPELFEKITGIKIDNTLALLDFREKIGKPVWIRHVLVPGLTMEDDQLKHMAELLRNYKCVEKIELLPFHKMGEYKWKQLGMEYKLDDVQPPSPSEVKHAYDIINNF